MIWTRAQWQESIQQMAESSVSEVDVYDQILEKRAKAPQGGLPPPGVLQGPPGFQQVGEGWMKFIMNNLRNLLKTYSEPENLDLWDD